MPLSMGMRDESNERRNNALKKLISLVFVPEGWNENTADAQLEVLGLSLDKLKTIPAEDLNKQLLDGGLDWANMEQFADFLAMLSAKPEYNVLKEKTKSLYSFIQAESKMFSFEIFNKVNALK